MPRPETVAEGLSVPWGLAFAPDGRIFLTERPGRIRVIAGGRLVPGAWARLEVDEAGESGLMGIAVAPDFERTGHVFVVGTFREGGRRVSRRPQAGGRRRGGWEGASRRVNRVVRFTEVNGLGAEPTVIVGGLPAAAFHAGAALAFGPDGMLYVTTGDVRSPRASRGPGSLAAKILRYRPDGTIPPDNPTRGSPVYARGVRNSQGLAWHPATGQLFASEHGPSFWPDERLRREQDELNRILPGGDYGWPEVSGLSEDPGFAPPIVEWTPGIAPSGLAASTARERQRVTIFVGGLKGRQLRKVVLERVGGRAGWRAVSQESWYAGELGRLRAVAMGPDGFLYFTTSNRDGRASPAPEDDRVFRIPIR